MLLAKSITPKKINALSLRCYATTIILIAFVLPAFSQDNSPYTRYGLGDIVPSTNINSRGMGGISAAYMDPYGLTINFNNPASFSRFQITPEPKSKRKLAAGRAVLDVGINLDNRTLEEPGNPNKFGNSNLLFSHVQVGVPISQKLGVSFGIHPITRISYKIGRFERLYDPIFNTPIDSAYTQYEGEGGTYLVAAGAGYKLVENDKHKLSIGFNAGYLFGKKDYSTKRILLNDTVEYYRANYQTKTVIGNWYFNAGLLYRTKLTEKIALSLGAYGNLENKLKATQDVIRETYVEDPSFGTVQLDSVSVVKGIKGKAIYPMSFTGGFVIEKLLSQKETGWLVGVDFHQSKWADYRFYGMKDSVRNKWELRVGGELRPAPTKNYFSNVAYRIGFFIGPDYIKVNEKLPQLGLTFGLGLPLANWGRAYGSFNQGTIINLAFEYIKRGNDDNLLRENMFRVSFGLSLSDLWFIKRKYD
ncbi:MAG TPA: hypothetical protein VF476_08360 [Chitinophagaceae bacterium]